METKIDTDYVDGTNIRRDEELMNKDKNFKELKGMLLWFFARNVRLKKSVTRTYFLFREHVEAKGNR